MNSKRSKVTIWHNPRCSKSRAALQLLRDNGVEPEIVEYLRAPPDAATIARTLHLLGMSPRELMRRNEPPYRELGLDDAGMSDAELIEAMAANPILIERPVVVAGRKAVLGRPPERVQDVLDD
ncbi:MAG: arsenate reductase (glutaredoxin) [Gammaproteobacteria bacterium]|jgi:arsenate reductase|nr:arsenate reductase (glutaredoxin) [Gammaproteobacteria bacterium]